MHDSCRRQYAHYISHGGDGVTNLVNRAQGLGYDADFLNSVLGDDNPIHWKLLFAASCGPGCPLRLVPSCPKEGDVVVDLGCGAGHDVILASRIVGPTGKVVGVDLTQEMIHGAQQNVKLINSNHKETAAAEIEFTCAAIDRQCEAEEALQTNMADVVMSNGVFNLCDDKGAAFQTAWRILKPGGTFLLSDVCRVQETNPSAVSCVVLGDSWSN